ncbi:N-chimaerin-like isoform X1 [Daphnia carinata]|uniref:N-chimaerin-like isoform X1 n=1 Tax=Daphnia carinata TaxID=120202 RepID=UPI00257D034B|nr:N-chimaerin-like isoform X1 [Daphnia carinata]XP_057375866.1 N-chimaerin-like isoform X1 [Daphnia carinata]
MSNNEEENDSLTLSPVWKSYLYQLQQEAPTAIAIPCYSNQDDANKPHYFDNEYHGSIANQETQKLLQKDGHFLVRESGRNRGHHTLSLKFNGELKHYRLYFDGQFFVGEKKFDLLLDLVNDGLITMHLEIKAGDYIHLMCRAANYEQSPYFTLNERKRRTLSLGRNRPALVQPISDDIHYDKAHVFRIQNFKGLHWCDFCGNFMWGIVAQGVRCEDCGLSAHRKCSEKIPADCCPDLKLLRGVFGVDLTTLNKAHGSTRIPFLVDMCVKEIERRGLCSEGIYRVSGLRDDVEALRVTFDRDGDKTDLGPSSWEDINVIAGVLKLYFRLLPIPLIAFQVYPLMMTAAKEPDENRRSQRIKDAVQLLPPAHYNSLKYLIFHLHRVAENKEKNKMSSLNLSTVWCPTLFPGPDLQEINSTGSIPDFHLEATCLDVMIRQPLLIFSSV